MKKILSLSFVICMILLPKAQNVQLVYPVAEKRKMIAREIPVIKYEMLDEKIKGEKDVLLVLNFWSTTCAPCIKELPDFMEIHNKYRENPKFKMLLVSLDRLKDKDRVMEFIKTKKLNAEVVLLDDVKRMNTWIPHFEKNWGGNIPVTIVYKNSEKVHFNDGEMTKAELENLITKNL